MIAIKAWNEGGVAGLVGRLEVVSITDRHKLYSTDGTWRSSSEVTEGWESPDFNAKKWKAATETGKLGDEPWGDVFALAQQGGTDIKKSIPADLKLAKDFKSELLYNVPKGTQGSWVAVCVDDQGRIIASAVLKGAAIGRQGPQRNAITVVIASLDRVAKDQRR